MKSLIIALSIVYIIFIIDSNAFTSSNLLSLKEQQEAYQACKNLKNKAPNLRLNCENLSPKKEEKNKFGVKVIKTEETETRKVNKNEEIKLRNLIKKLKNENSVRKD